MRPTTTGDGTWWWDRSCWDVVMAVEAACITTEETPVAAHYALHVGCNYWPQVDYLLVMATQQQKRILLSLLSSQCAGALLETPLWRPQSMRLEIIHLKILYR